MSAIRIDFGTAQVELQGPFDVRGPGRVVVVGFAPSDLLQATAAALRAVDTEEARSWATSIMRLTQANMVDTSEPAR